MIYRFLCFLFRIATRLFYSKIEVVGRKNLPASGPVLLVPNHPNGLIDVVVIAVEMERPLSMTGKSTLAKIPVVGQIMKAIHVIPMHRRQDAAEGSDPTRNVDSLAECRHRLAEGGALCIFPEGISHSRPRVAPLRTGAARIALDYLRIDGNPGGLKIVPVGLYFDDKDRFRSRGVLRFGEPLDPAAWVEAHPEAGPRELTAEIEERLHEAALSFDRAGEAWLIRWAAEAIGAVEHTPAPIGREGPSLARQVDLQDQLRAGYRTLKTAAAGDLAHITARVRHYRGELRDFGIDPAEVFLPMSRLRAVWFCVRELLVAAVAGPIALWGTLNNAIPFLAVRQIAIKYSDDRCVTSSYALVPSFVLFPLCYLIQTLAAGLVLARHLHGGSLWLAIAAYAALLPAAGYVAIRFYDRMAAALRRARTYLRFRLDPALRARLKEEGRGIVKEIATLAKSLGL